jgi:hypothetical protein
MGALRLEVSHARTAAFSSRRGGDAAADERPLDKCLADVRSCQAYVGIVAWLRL